MTAYWDPHLYQSIGSRFIIEHPRCQVNADMGLGKTGMTLGAMDILQLAGSNFFPAIIFAPKRVAQLVWSGERDKWDAFQGLKVEKILGNPKQRMAVLKRPRADIYVINWDLIPWICSTLRGKWPFRFAVADECRRLKGFRLMGQGGVRVTALSQIARETGRWVNLTGTPATKGLEDLWGQYWFLDFGARLGHSYTRFMERYFEVNQYTHEIKLLPGADVEIHKAIADITLSLRGEDWLPTQKPQYVKVEAELPPDARAIYDPMADDYYTQIGEVGIEAPNAAAQRMKMLQLCSGSMYDAEGNEHPVHDAKLDALEDIVDESGEPLLVAYWWKFDPPRILRRFPNARLLKTSQDVADWNNGKIEMLLIHPASAGHGLNLQYGGRSLVFFSETWDLELRQQVIERIGPARQWQAGFNRLVYIYDIVTRNTVEDDVMDGLLGKITVQDALKLAHARRKM